MNTALAVQDNRLTVMDPRGGSDVAWWNMAREQAAMLVKTGFLPEAIKSPEQAVAIMMKGRELGIPAMYALSNIVVIKGKPTCNAELMLALIYRDHGDAAIRVAESTNARCVVAYRRRGWPKEQTQAFTAEDAQRAGLMTSDTWKKYTAAMLRARCISAVARMAFPDTIAGMYTPEELGAAAEVADDEPITGVYTGDVVDTATGEILDAADAPQDGPGRTETVAAVSDDPDRYEGGCTKKQLQRINIMRQEKGISSDELKRMHGKASGKLLTEGEANALMVALADFPDIVLDAPDDDADQAVMPGVGGRYDHLGQ